MKTQVLAAAIVALIATIGTVLLLEFNIRVSRAVDPTKKPEPIQKARVNNVFFQLNNISAYGRWIKVYRIAAVVVVVGSIVTIVLALLV